jgi:hypothetical protein
MESDASGLGLVKEVCGNRLLHILSQLLPSVAFCEDVVRQTLRRKAAVSFLTDTKDDFHALNLSSLRTKDKLPKIASGLYDAESFLANAPIKRGTNFNIEHRTSNNRQPMVRTVISHAKDAQANAAQIVKNGI